MIALQTHHEPALAACRRLPFVRLSLDTHSPLTLHPRFAPWAMLFSRDG